MKWGVLGLACIALAGCQTAAQQQDPPIWGRFDCKRVADDPEVATLFEQAKAVCINRAEAAGVAGSSSIPVGYGMGGAIASGIQRGITHNEIATATAKSCMAEYGFTLALRREHELRCPAPIAAPPPATPTRRAMRVSHQTRAPAGAPPVTITPASHRVAPTASMQTIPASASR